jgi:protein SCO1/2
MKRSFRRSLATLALVALAGLSASTAVAAQKVSPTKRANSRWGGEYFPNVPLITHEGEHVRFFDDLIKDKVVMINFIYTSCPDSCPLETARLKEVKSILGDRVGDDVFMYSISIDPEVDTPEVLKKYTEQYRTGPGWTFLTGKESDIVLLRQKLGLYIQEIQNDPGDHNLSMIIGNQATGRWQKSSPFENPYVLANQMGEWLHNWTKPRDPQADYSDAPELRQVSKGETLFRTRCAACHDFNETVGEVRYQTKVGPSLRGVIDRRDPQWLSRWLAEPEVMLEEGDPIAVGLKAAYNEVPMPNMRLNPREIELLMEFMGEESDRVTSHEAAVRGSMEAPLPCCDKKDAPIQTADASTAAGTDDPDAAGERRDRQAGFGRSEMLFVGGVGLGLALGLVAFFMSRRRLATRATV